MALKCAFLFPGQGSQAVGMGREFFENFQTARDMFIQAEERTGINFEELLFEKNDKLELTEFTQPSILLVSSIANRLFMDEVDITPTFLLGHSLGEFSALVSTGALNVMDGLELVHLRGKVMSEACRGKDVGMMVALGASDKIVEELTERLRGEGRSVWAVNYNADGQIVIAGIRDDLKQLEPLLKDAGAKRTIILNMSVASHCPLLNSALSPLEKALEKVLKETFKAPIVSNVTAQKYSSKDEALKLLPKQLVSPVLYKQSIKNFDDEVECYIEFGHGNVLKGLNRRATKKPHLNISNLKNLEESIKSIKGMV